ncbi:MAG: hypothetical protein EOP04_01365 [Proteobacteria bacterium]|nr:MAG: hypothetical protein EOP04_01365 [Pseudomonadota bacterium]
MIVPPPRYLVISNGLYSALLIENLTAQNIQFDDRGIDSDFKIKYSNELNSLPATYLNMIGAEHVPYRMINGGVTNFEELSSVKGKPFNSMNPDDTWDDVGGIMTVDGVLGTALAGENSVSIHESGHVIDFLANLSLKSREFKKIFDFYSLNPT